MKFIESRELKQISVLNENAGKVIVWGTGKVGRQVYKTLEALHIRMDYFVDSNSNQVGKECCQKPILAPLELGQIPIAYIIIASYAYYPIMLRLKALGFESNVYAITDSMKYDIDEYNSDTALLQQNRSTAVTTKSKRILLEVYGNIGDAILKIGITKAMIDCYGKSNIYVLVESDVIAKVYQLIADNIIIFNEHICIDDRAKRQKILADINQKNFQYSIILCDIRLLSTRRILDRYICNIADVRFDPQLPNQEYLLGLTEKLVKRVCIPVQEMNLSPVGCLDSELNSATFHSNQRISLPERYVAVHMGASIPERHYSPYKFSKVVNYLCNQGYQVILVGEGQYDEEYAEILLAESERQEKIYNYVSTLTITETFYLIRHAAFFVGTDSGMWNASYILNTPSVVLYGGGEYGCFRHSSSKIHYVETKDRSCFGCRWFCKHKDADGYSHCIGGLQPEQIIQKVNEVINELQQN